MNTVIHEKEVTVGSELNIGPLMSLVDNRLLKTLGLPRSSLSASVSADWNVHKYKLSLIPDRKRYDVTVSMERDGVTVFLSQPNQVKYFPTWTSGHCEYIKGRGDFCEIFYPTKKTNPMAHGISEKYLLVDKKNPWDSKILLFPEKPPPHQSLKNVKNEKGKPLPRPYKRPLVPVVWDFRDPTRKNPNSENVKKKP